MHTDKILQDNMRKGMNQWAEELIKTGAFPVVLVYIKKVGKGLNEVGYYRMPTITDKRAKEYLQYLLDNWENLR